MGVHGLTGILRRYAPNSVRKVSCNAFARQSVAIDASCHLNKFIYGDEVHPFRHIYGFYLLARFCDLNNINPIFVFDGPKRLEAKQLEHAKRARQRKKVKYSLVLEKEQSNRLDNWLYASSNESLVSKESAILILNELGETLQKIEDDTDKQTMPPTLADHQEIETKLFQTAQELRIAIETAENTEKYTKTVRSLVNRELELISEMATNGFQHIKPALTMLKKDNQAMLASLEKRSVRITQDIREECQQFLKTLGYICFSCDNHEAEAMCAHFGKAGRTTATVSEDMDTLVFGDVPILRYFFSRGRPILQIDPIIARKELGLSRKEFIDFCILCGTDFSGTIQGIGPNRALSSMRKYGSIEELLKNLESRFVPQTAFDYKLARQVFDDLPPIPTDEKAYRKPSTSDIDVQDILEHYQIDRVDADVKLRTVLLQQTIIDSHSWGTDPFSHTISRATIMNLPNF